MANNQGTIDFRELNVSTPGEDLEGLARQIGIRKGLNPIWSGRGADQGKDLLFLEKHAGPIREVVIKWLVSCKDKAVGGSSVGEQDLPHDIHAKLEQHNAQGFLLVTTTRPSTNAKELLDRLDIRCGGRIYTEVWDEIKLREILLEADNAELVKQFLPQSYRRLLGLTTLPGALEAFRDQLPRGVFETVQSAIAPYTDGSISNTLQGFTIWPQDSATAFLIDDIVKLLLVEKEVQDAAKKCRGISPEALVALLYSLQRQDYMVAYKLAVGVLKHTSAVATVDIRLNSAQFLADNYDMPQVIVYAELLDLFRLNKSPVPSKNLCQKWGLQKSCPAADTVGMSQAILEACPAPAVTPPTTKPKSLPTIWNVPDDLWATMARVLAVYDPPAAMGRPRIDQRRALDGIIYRARTGCQWNHLPAEFGDDVSVHRTMQRWESRGVFDILWAVLLTKCEALRGVDWSWQSADCALGKARGAGKRGHRRRAGQTAPPQSACATPRSASARTRPIAPSRGSRGACLPRAEAARLAS